MKINVKSKDEAVRLAQVYLNMAQPSEDWWLVRINNGWKLLPYKEWLSHQGKSEDDAACFHYEKNNSWVCYISHFKDRFHENKS